MTDWKRYEIKKCRIKFRRTEKLVVKPEAEALNGREVELMIGWRIEEDDRRYPNEWALITAPGHDRALFPLTWIASGDVQILA